MRVEQIKRTVYIAFDGKEFSTERACRKHEIDNNLGDAKMAGGHDLTAELIRRRKADIEEAHKAVDAIRRCWLIEAELWDRIDRIERQNNLKIYDPFGFNTPYLNRENCRERAGKCWPFSPPELWDEAALKKARQMKYVAKLLKERKVKL